MFIKPISRSSWFIPVKTNNLSLLLKFSCFNNLNAKISDSNTICFLKILFYFWSNVKIKSHIDCFLLYHSKSLNLSQLPNISSFCIFPSRNAINLLNPTSSFSSLIDNLLNTFWRRLFSSCSRKDNVIAIPCFFLSVSVISRQPCSKFDQYCSYVLA